MAPTFTTKESLVREADKAHAQYPQYKGHWDDWIAVPVIRQVKVHGQVALRRGDFCLYKPGSRHIADPALDPWLRASAVGKEWATYYLPRPVAVDTEVRTWFFDMSDVPEGQ